MGLGGLSAVVRSCGMVAMCVMRRFRRFGMAPRSIMCSRLFVVLGSLPMMLRCVAMVLSGWVLLCHYYPSSRGRMR